MEYSMIALFLLSFVSANPPLDLTRQRYLSEPPPPPINCLIYNATTDSLETIVCEAIPQGPYWLWPACIMFYKDRHPEKDSYHCWGEDRVSASRCYEECPPMEAPTDRKYMRCSCLTDMCNH